MERTHPHSSFITDLGGSGEVAAALSIPQNTISNWRQRGIPWRYRYALVQVAGEKKIAIPDGFLTEEPSAEPAPQPEQATQ